MQQNKKNCPVLYKCANFSSICPLRASFYAAHLGQYILYLFHRKAFEYAPIRTRPVIWLLFIFYVSACYYIGGGYSLGQLTILI